MPEKLGNNSHFEKKSVPKGPEMTQTPEILLQLRWSTIFECSRHAFHFRQLREQNTLQILALAYQG